MRTPLLLTAALILAVAFIYYAGNFTPTDTPRPLTNPTVQPTTATPVPTAPLTPDQARQLTSQQRLDLIKKTIESYERDKSDDYLCSLIAALTKDEISEANDIIKHFDTAPSLEGLGFSHLPRKIQSRIYTDRIRETLSMQWGRVDPATWLDENIRSLVAKSKTDVRNVMKGWFETDPVAALAWAQSPRETDLELTAAAEVLTLSAVGDPQKLADALLAFPAGDQRVKNCLWDYFDLIATTTGNPDPAAIYENIPAPLRDAAWPITIDRLTDSDFQPQTAVDWLTAHVNDPGRHYGTTFPLIVILTRDDPSGTAQWAATLPDDTTDEAWLHPAFQATSFWLEKDPVAAKAWLQTQPSTLHWVEETLKHIEEQETPKEPEADKTEK